MKKIILTLSAVVFVLAMASSCQQRYMLEKVKCTITLDESNTYMTGDSVVFNFDGNADNIVFYSGEIGHQYKYHDRYSITPDDVESMKLSLNIQHRAGHDIKGLEIFYTGGFDGLKGDDGEADMRTIKNLYDGGMKGWFEFPYDDPGVDPGVYHTFEAELDPSCIYNLTIAFHWNSSDIYPDGVADTYWVNGSLYVAIAGVDESNEYDLMPLVGTVVMMNEIDGTYYFKDKGDCSIQLNASAVLFQGGSYSTGGHSCDGWLFSYPSSFVSDVTADEGHAVKSMALEEYSYGYTYYEPGDYVTTFVCTNANYTGSSRTVIEIPLTITGEAMENPGDTGGGSDDDDDEDDE